MSDATSQFWFWLILIFSIFIPSSSAEKKNITAEPGQEVILPCRAPNIMLVEWSRADPKPGFVFVYRNKQFDPENQHPSFKNRVDLQDRQMKDGDVSVILKNVTIIDTGTYECRVMDETKSWKNISIINLSVVDPPGPTGGVRQDGGNEDGSVGLIVGLPVSVGLLFLGVAVGILIYIRCRKRQPPDDRQLDSCSLQTCEETLLEKVP